MIEVEQELGHSIAAEVADNIAASGHIVAELA